MYDFFSNKQAKNQEKSKKLLINRHFVNKKLICWVFLGLWKHKKMKLVESKAF
jgi:hypothetical protein